MADGRAIARVMDITERKRAEARIAFMAHHDALTGLPNRILLRQRMEEILQQRGAARQAAVMCSTSTTSRRSTIRSATARRRAAARRRQAPAVDGARGRHVARLGGDEFAIVQSGLEAAGRRRAAGAAVIGGDRRALSARRPSSSSAPASASRWRRATASSRQLLKNADMALYRAKADGARHVPLLRAGDGRARAGAARAGDRPARRDRERRASSSYYQPLIDLATGRITGFEALLRWHASRPRPDLAGRVHSGRRGDRPDRAARRHGCCGRPAPTRRAGRTT